MRIGLTLAAASLALWTVAVQAADRPAPVKLAIVATSPELGPAADLLMTELSKEPGVVLLERDQISRVIAEQSLALGQPDVSARIGKLLAADGVVTLGIRSVSNTVVQETRVIAVNPGVIVAASYRPESSANLDAWAALTRESIAEVLPKLEVSARDAIPLSVLNLRSVLPGAKQKEIEQELTWRVIHRLANEPRIFMLEREQMLRLAFEKEMTTTSGGEFWSSRYVVNGQVEEPSNGLLRVTLYLEHPGQAARTIRVEGSHDDPAKLADSLADAILRELGQGGISTNWEPAGEGRRFFEEADSAARAGLAAQALASAEASDVLGFRSEAQQALLIRLYADSAFVGITNDMLLVRPHPPVASIDATNVDVDSALRALEHLNGWLAGTYGFRPTPGSGAAQPFAALALLNASRVIRWYWENHLYAGRRDDLDLIRAQIREAMARTNLVDQLHPSRDLYAVMAAYAPYWFDDDSEVLATYDTVLSQWFFGYPDGGMSTLRNELVAARDKPQFFSSGDLDQRTPWLIDWRGAGNAQTDGTWQAYVSRHVISTNFNDRLDGRLLAYYSTTNDANRARIASDEMDDLWANRDRVATNLVSFDITDHVVDGLSAPPDFKFKLFDFLLKNTPFSEYSLMELFRLYPVYWVTNQADAVELHQSLQAFEKRVWPSGPRSTPELNGYNAYRQYLDSFVQAYPQFHEQSPAGLSVTLRWPAASAAGPAPADAVSRQVAWAEGAVWISRDRATDGGHYQTVFDRVTLPDFQLTEVAGPYVFPKPSASTEDYNHAFAVDGTRLFWAHGSNLERLDLTTGKWTAATIPQTRFPFLKVAGDSLYYAFPGNSRFWANEPSESGILRINPDTLQATVLASSRRKPARSPLDDTTAYTVEDLFAGPSNLLTAAIRIGHGVQQPGQRTGELWSYSETEDKWGLQHPDVARHFVAARAAPFDGGAVIQPVDESSDVTFFLYRDGTLSFMFPGPDDLPPTGGFHHTHSSGLSPTQIWEWCSWNPIMFSTDGRDLWVLGPRRGTGDAPYNLYVFSGKGVPPGIVPLQFPNGSGFSSSEFGGRSRGGMLNTPSGLVLFNIGDPAFWFLPKEQVTAALGAIRADVKQKEQP